MNDIIVVGGGIAGISAAARLSHLGKVLVLETETSLGYHASGRSAALFEENYGLPAVTALNRASHAYLATANGGVLSPRGLMLVAGSGEEADFAHDCADMQLDQITVDEAVGMIPVLNRDRVTLAAFHDAAWDVDTDRLIQNFARELRGNGGTILTGAKVEAIRRTGTGWEVTAKGETHHGALIVNAAGAWADQIAAIAGMAPIGITPFRRSMARIPAPEGYDVSSWPMIFGVNESWYAKPDAGALIVSPADADPTEPHDAWADDMVLAEGLARYEEHVTTPVTRVLSNWAGLRSFAPDRLLVIGPEPDNSGFLWCAGQGGYGFQSSAAYSQLLADLVAGRQPEVGQDVARALSPARFR